MIFEVRGSIVFEKRNEIVKGCCFILMVVIGVAAAAPATKPAAEVVKFPGHPRLILPDSELARVKQRIKDQDWAKGALGSCRSAQRRGWGNPSICRIMGGSGRIIMPAGSAGRGWRRKSPTRHVCPACGAVYTGWPYDDVAISRRHNEFADAARDLGLVYRISGDKRLCG